MTAVAPETASAVAGSGSRCRRMCDNNAIAAARMRGPLGHTAGSEGGGEQTAQRRAARRMRSPTATGIPRACVARSRSSSSSTSAGDSRAISAAIRWSRRQRRQEATTRIGDRHRGPPVQGRSECRDRRQPRGSRNRQQDIGSGNPTVGPARRRWLSRPTSPATDGMQTDGPGSPVRPQLRRRWPPTLRSTPRGCDSRRCAGTPWQRPRTRRWKPCRRLRHGIADRSPKAVRENIIRLYPAQHSSPVGHVCLAQRRTARRWRPP